MATSLVFTDDTGTVTLTNGFDPPGDRFRSWKLLGTPIGPIHYGLGTGIPYRYIHRTDYGASFELPYIPNESQGDALRCIIWLLSGGSITVNTGDTFGSSYTCYLWPGTTPELSPPDRQDLRRTLSLTVLQTTNVPMICQYP